MQNCTPLPQSLRASSLPEGAFGRSSTPLSNFKKAPISTKHKTRHSVKNASNIVFLFGYTPISTKHR